MDRRIAEPVLLAALAIVALAAAAATLPTATQSGGGGTGSGPPGSGGGDGGLIPPPDPAPTPLIDLPDLGPLLAVLTAAMLLAALLYVLLYRRQALRLLLGLTGIVVLLALVFWLASLVDPDPSNAPGWGGSLFGEPAGSAGEPTPTSNPLVLLLVAGVVMAGVVAVLVRSGTLSPLRSSADDPETSEEAAAVGRAAGRAADRIEDSDDLDNEIYRAWREMTALLDVKSPGTSTPGEFAAAGVAAGMDRGDVGELTRLFEDVRYGGDEPTATDERRALAIFRRIEEAYAPEEGTDAADVTGAPEGGA